MLPAEKGIFSDSPVTSKPLLPSIYQRGEDDGKLFGENCEN
jgi:hypothetical protein